MQSNYSLVILCLGKRHFLEYEPSLFRTEESTNATHQNIWTNNLLYILSKMIYL